MKIDINTARKLKKIVEEISVYEEGDTGDTPGYFVDEDLSRYVNDILKLLGFEEVNWLKL